jgi:hypothetical protein
VHFTVPSTMLQILLLQQLSEVTHKPDASHSNRADIHQQRFLCTSIDSYLSFIYELVKNRGRDGVVGVATRYGLDGLDGPGIESRCRRIFRPVQTGPGAHSASYIMGTGSFPGVMRPGHDVDHPTPLASRLKKK